MPEGFERDLGEASELPLGIILANTFLERVVTLHLIASRLGGEVTIRPGEMAEIRQIWIRIEEDRRTVSLYPFFEAVEVDVPDSIPGRNSVVEDAISSARLLGAIVARCGGTIRLPAASIESEVGSDVSSNTTRLADRSLWIRVVCP